MDSQAKLCLGDYESSVHEADVEFIGEEGFDGHVVKVVLIQALHRVRGIRISNVSPRHSLRFLGSRTEDLDGFVE